MMNQRLDRTAIIVIAACVLVVLFYPVILRWMGFGQYVDPARKQTTVVDTTSTPATTSTPSAAVGSTNSGASTPTGTAAPGATRIESGEFRSTTPQIERSLAIETPLYRAEFSNRGGRLLSMELKHYAAAHGVSSADGKIHAHRPGREVPPGDRVQLAGGPLLALDLGSPGALHSLEPVVFAVAESLDAAGDVRVLTFTHRDSSGMFVRQTYRVRPDDYSLEYEVELRGVPEVMRVADYSLTTRSWPLLSESDMGSDAKALRATSLVGSNIHREGAGGLVRGPKRFDGNAQWAAVQTRYFVVASAVREGTSRGVVAAGERRPLPPETIAVLPRGTAPQQEIAISSLVMSMPGELSPVNRFLVYAGPSEYFRLDRLDARLDRAVDLGWTWLLPFSKALLQLLIWTFGVVKNYGVAIIILASLVRLVLHPLNAASLKSMRGLQKLQPEVERLKQKYKSDPQAMNAAMMALYKEHKVNPAGGCLPLILQMPLFIALYNVLFNAIELRQAPFVAWMTDLSAPDHVFSIAGFPIRLLPILMAGSGLLQQKVTPTPPEQRPTMYIMNVVMLVFFYNLPSGLVLYWTVMNLLTAFQSWLVYRQDGGPIPVATATPATATAGGGRRRRG
jgi:YidC/Oxa1 family membrane protein insertase